MTSVYLTAADLILLTGTSETSATTVQAIIDEAEREVNAYLDARGVSGSGDVCKSATVSLSKSGLLELAVQKGTYIQSSGEMVTGPNTNAASSALSMAKYHRDYAYRLLNEFIAVQSSLSTPRRMFVRKVN